MPVSPVIPPDRPPGALLDEAGEAARSGPTLARIVEGALRDHAFLLLDDELAVLRAFLALPGPEANLLARLLWRVHVLLRPDLEDEADRALLPSLQSAGFLEEVAGGDGGAERLRVEELRAACRDLGLPSRGARETLVERLREVDGLPTPALLRVAHRRLFRRMEVLFFRRIHPDHRVEVLEALGLRRPIPYEPGPPAPLFASRESMLRFEALRESLESDPSPEVLLEVLPAAREEPPESLLRLLLLRGLAERARHLEREGRPAEAARLHEALVDLGQLEALPRLVLDLEASGRAEEACGLAREARHRVEPATALALDRSGRRIARGLSLPWPPLPPLRSPARRRVPVEACETPASPRARWRGPGGPVSIELAVVHALAVLGRRALHAENSPWSTLFALLFRDAFFLPLPGVLPVRGLGGPLDLGSPSFYARRRSLIEERLARVAAGGGPSLLAERDALHRGEALAGADWSLPAPILREIVEALPGPVLAEVLGRLAREGHTARRGMPDLVVLPGPTTRWEGAFPERLPEALFLAEVKGPGDAVRDDQSLWFDRLLGAGLRVELWQAARET